jgi:hypothetical protein
MIFGHRFVGIDNLRISLLYSKLIIRIYYLLMIFLVQDLKYFTSLFSNKFNNYLKYFTINLQFIFVVINLKSINF